MTLTPLEVSCDHCRKKHTRQVKTFEPESFSPNGTKSIFSQWWCPRCGTVNAVRYEFYRKDLEILARVKSRVPTVGSAYLTDREQED